MIHNFKEMSFLSRFLGQFGWSLSLGLSWLSLFCLTSLLSFLSLLLLLFPLLSLIHRSLHLTPFLTFKR